MATALNWEFEKVFFSLNGLQSDKKYNSNNHFAFVRRRVWRFLKASWGPLVTRPKNALCSSRHLKSTFFPKKEKGCLRAKSFIFFNDRISSGKCSIKVLPAKSPNLYLSLQWSKLLVPVNILLSFYLFQNSEKMLWWIFYESKYLQIVKFETVESVFN